MRPALIGLAWTLDNNASNYSQHRALTRAFSYRKGSSGNLTVPYMNLDRMFMMSPKYFKSLRSRWVGYCLNLSDIVFEMRAFWI